MNNLVPDEEEDLVSLFVSMMLALFMAFLSCKYQESEFPEGSVQEDEESSNHVTSDTLDTLAKKYNDMQENRKWKLSTGKCVEDELYKFARQCTYEQ